MAKKLVVDASATGSLTDEQRERMNAVALEAVKVGDFQTAQQIMRRLEDAPPYVEPELVDLTPEEEKERREREKAYTEAFTAEEDAAREEAKLRKDLVEAQTELDKLADKLEAGKASDAEVQKALAHATRGVASLTRLLLGKPK